jgi:hypothetical protein
MSGRRKHRRKHREDKPEASQQPVERKGMFHRPKFLDYVIIRLSVPLGFAAIGAGLMLANLWLLGVILLYLGLGLFALDVAYEEFFRRWPMAIRVSSGITYALLIVFASHEWIFLPAPMEVTPFSNVTEYGPGSKLHDIDWLPRYSQLRVDINNPTSTDYDSFDAQLTTDLVINHLVQVGGLSQCEIEGIHGINEPAHWQHMQRNQPVGPIDDPLSEYQVIPRDKNGNAIVPFMGSDWTYRIRCDKIAAHNRLQLFGALVVINPHAYECQAPCPWPFFDSPKPAQWVTLVAEFFTSGRKRRRTVAKCKTGSTCRNGTGHVSF